MAKIKKYQIGGYVVNQRGDTLRGKAAVAEKARQRQFEEGVIKENPASKIKSAVKSAVKAAPKKAKAGSTVKKAKMGCANCGKTMKKK